MYMVKLAMKNDALLTSAKWINQPRHFSVEPGAVQFSTEPHTDFWQRTYYGFRNGNAPALLFQCVDNITFSTRVRFDYRRQFDQCGVMIYIDDQNWFKASIEFENESVSRLSSVVTNSGYSDWATTDITPCREIWYRLNRRGPDFLIEHSSDGKIFQQMRVFHLAALGTTSAEMGRLPAAEVAALPTRMGIYACSPDDATFNVKFDNFSTTPSTWQAHTTEQSG